MHWSGKVFAWLLIPLILAGMVLSAKLVRVRNSYAAKLEKAKNEYERRGAQIGCCAGRIESRPGRMAPGHADLGPPHSRRYQCAKPRDGPVDRRAGSRWISRKNNGSTGSR